MSGSRRRRVDLTAAVPAQLGAYSGVVTSRRSAHARSPSARAFFVEPTTSVNMTVATTRVGSAGPDGRSGQGRSTSFGIVEKAHAARAAVSVTDRLERAGQVESCKRDRELKWQEERAERREPARGQIGPAVPRDPSADEGGDPAPQEQVRADRWLGAASCPQSRRGRGHRSRSSSPHERMSARVNTRAHAAPVTLRLEDGIPLLVPPFP